MTKIGLLTAGCIGCAFGAGACYEAGFRFVGNAFIATSLLLFSYAMIVYLDNVGKPK